MIVLLQLGQWIIGKILGRIPMALKDKFCRGRVDDHAELAHRRLCGEVHNDFQLKTRHERTISRLQSLRRFRANSETPLGRVIQWKPTGSIAHKHRNGAVTGLVAVGSPLALGYVLAPQIYPRLYLAAQVSAAEL